jgi:hypothetical protein
MNQSGSNGILFNVIPDSLELLVIPDQAIIAFFLPERLPRQPQHLIRSLRSDAFKRLRNLGMPTQPVTSR